MSRYPAELGRGARPAAPPPRYLPPPPYPPGQVPVQPRRREPRQSPVIAPVLALLGVLLIGGASVWAFSLLASGSEEPAPGAIIGALPSPSAPVATEEPIEVGPEATDDLDFGPEITDPPEATFEPIVVAPIGERPDIKGTIVFSRGGDIWAATGYELRKLTGGNSDTQPTWSHDGKFIYYIRTNKRTTSNSRPGGLYTLFVPDIMRMNADGSNKKRVYTSLLRNGGLWFSQTLQPDMGPDGRTLALVSDGPNGSGAAIVLYLLDVRSGKLKKVDASSYGSLGHNDPEWSPDGRKIAYTRNRNVGFDGVPAVTIHTCKTRKNCTDGKDRRLRSGYANPSWSPDSSWLAVEETRGNGRDIAILNTRRGDPRIVLTDDGNSFAPVVSPDGDQIAYLHRDGLKVDLRVMTLDIDADGKITLVSDQAVTTDGALDPESPPAWYIPKSQLTPRATPRASAAAEPSADVESEPTS